MNEIGVSWKNNAELGRVTNKMNEIGVSWKNNAELGRVTNCSRMRCSAVIVMRTFIRR